MSIYTKANSDVNELVNELVTSFYPDMEECQATISVFMVDPSGGKIDKPALTTGGYPVDGAIRIVPYKDRVAGMTDVIFYLDGPNWFNVDDDQHRSIVDRLLYSLELQRDKKSGAYKTDDRGRPTIKRKKYDFQVNGYDLIIHRYGRAGADAKAIEDLSLHYNTLLPADGDADDQPVGDARGHQEPTGQGIEADEQYDHTAAGKPEPDQATGDEAHAAA